MRNKILGKIFLSLILLFTIVHPYVALGQQPSNFVEVGPADLPGVRKQVDEYNEKVEFENAYLPTMLKKEKTDVASKVVDTTKCTLGNVAASAGARLYNNTVDKVAAIAVNPNLVPVFDVLNAQKDVGLAGGALPGWDAIGYCLLNSIIQYISDATVDWINNGFNGNPVFVDDPSRILEDVAWDTITAYVDAIGKGILCENFSSKVTLAIVGNFKSQRRVVPDRCTLQEAVANIDRFMSGADFSFEVLDVVTSNPNNNVIGAYLLAESRLGDLTATRQDGLKAELSWGDGFLSWKDDNGKTVTPGSYIGLNSGKALGLSMDRLVLADEFDEIVTALVNQLIKTAYNEVLGDDETQKWDGKNSL